MFDQLTEESQLQEVVEHAANPDQNEITTGKSLDLENSIFPIELLYVLQDTAFETVKEYLKNSYAPQVVIDLLDDLDVLNAEISFVKDGKVARHSNENLKDLVPSISNNIVKSGGVFHATEGMTVARPIAGELPPFFHRGPEYQAKE